MLIVVMLLACGKDARYSHALGVQDNHVQEVWATTWSLPSPCASQKSCLTKSVGGGRQLYYQRKAWQRNFA